MSMALLCASHTPLMDEGRASDAVRNRVTAGFAQLGTFVRTFAPDLVIQFSPDHFNGFLYDLMPAFCIGTSARSVGDWDTREGELPVPEARARALADYVMASGVDVAISYRMAVDHGFVQIWEKMLGRADLFPIIPIFVNAAAPPLPPYRRARALGEAVGIWARNSKLRVLIAASGGLSHDPPTPDIATAPAETRERLIAGRHQTPEMRRAHKSRVLAAGAQAAEGSGPCQALNPVWDRAIIDMFLSGDVSRFDGLDPLQVREAGGRGANEILAWVAAFAAQSAAGSIAATLELYEPVDGWIAGMAMMTAREVEC